jgi:hypothetical protein
MQTTRHHWQSAVEGLGFSSVQGSGLRVSGFGFRETIGSRQLCPSNGLNAFDSMIQRPECTGGAQHAEFARVCQCTLEAFTPLGKCAGRNRLACVSRLPLLTSVRRSQVRP